MKKIIAFLLCIQIVLIYSVTASAASAGAIKIDGSNSDNEWLEYSTNMMFENSVPGNGVDFAYMKFAFVKENNFKVLLIAQFKPVPESFENTGFRISVNGDDFYSVNVSEGTGKKLDTVNDEEIKIVSALSFDRSGSITGEFDITLKSENGENTEIGISVIDGDGIPSKITNYSLVNPFFTTTASVEQITSEKAATEKTTEEKTTKTTTEKTTKEKTTKTTTEKTTKEKTTKTTTEKTTKEKTTKTTTEKTTKEKTTKTTTEKTTKEKTTKATTEKASKDKSSDGERYSTFAVTEHSRRSARSSQSKETAKEKTAKSGKTSASEKSATEKTPEKVYVIERQVTESTPSVVYERVITAVTAVSTNSNSVGEAYYTGVTASEPSEEDDNGSLFGEGSLSKATKYKIIAGVLAFLLFTAVGIAAVHTKSEADEEEKEEKAKEKESDDNEEKQP